MRETLRLHPPVPAHTVRASETTVVGGKYKIDEGSTILINDRSIQRDTDESAWGADVSSCNILFQFMYLIGFNRQMTQAV